MSRLQIVRAWLIGSLAATILALGTPAAAHPTVDIVASNWHFTPSTITVEAGQATTLRLTSTSGTHGIASDELGIAATTIAQGRFVEVSFTPHTAGTFSVHCSIYCGAGHADMVLTVIVKGAAATAPLPTANPQPSAPPAPTPAPIRTPKPMIDDRHYIILMVHHDRISLQMAQLAVKNSHRSEIKALAKSLVARNSAAVVQLQRWYKVWYGSSVPDMPAMSSQSMQGMSMDMMRSMSPESLGSAPDFDRAFMIAGIHHESMGASMSLAAEQGLDHTELRGFARSDAATQLNDLQMLWHWFVKWYPEK